MWHRPKLTNSAAIQAQIQHLVLVHANIHSTYKLLVCREEPALQNQIQEHPIAIKDENLKHGCDPRWQQPQAATRDYCEHNGHAW